MSGQMCWLSMNQSNGEKILHLRTNPSADWRSYKAYPQYAVADYNIPGGSHGWATYQKLLRAGWRLVPSTQTNKQLTFVR